jgi:hypothetical protein
MSLATPIQQYISKKYDQHPDMFRHDLDVIDSMRRDAVNVSEVHQSGIKKLQRYAGQLVWMGGKFPIDVRCPTPDGGVFSADVLGLHRLAPTSPGILLSATTLSTHSCRTTSSTS